MGFEATSATPLFSHRITVANPSEMVPTQSRSSAIDGPETWTGRVESVRAGVGRMDPEQFVAVPAGDLSRRRVSVRIRLESANPFTANEFYGVGRSVTECSRGEVSTRPFCQQ